MIDTNIYEFEPSIVLPAYDAVHDWLLKKAPNYKNISDDVTKSGNLAIAGAHFDSFNHLHAFKAQKLTELLLQQNKLPKLFIPQTRHIVVDIACGNGAASIGFINSLVQPIVLSRLPKPFHIFFVGLDIDTFALEIYTEFLKQLKERLAQYHISLEFRCVPKGVPQGIYEVTNRIKEYLENQPDTPGLSSFTVFQMNAVRPFNDIDEMERASRKELDNRGVPIGDESDAPFSKSIIAAYRSLCETLRADEATFITVGTHDTRYPQKALQWKRAVANSGLLLVSEFSRDGHVIEDWTENSGVFQFLWKHPINSKRYWKYGNPKTPNIFYVDIKHYRNRTLIQDSQWQELISLENLKLAWARSRRFQMREALVDELEIRMFEQNLEINLERLQQNLQIYLNDIGQTFSRLAYAVPKKWNDERTDIVTRPRTLTRFEEDILAVAIVQVLGKTIDIPNSYEYRLESSDKRSEYLYEHYLQGYQDFIQVVRSEAERYKHKNALILQTDIQSFYTDISQHILVGSIPQQSSRIVWLLSQLLQRPIPEANETRGSHKPEHGLVQGGTASGFFAKLYLRFLHDRIGESQKRIALYRYADDIAVIIPNKKDDQLVRDTLRERLELHDLRLSSEKTMSYSPLQLLEKMVSQDDLNDIDQVLKDKIFNPLYTMSLTYRQYFDQCNEEGNWNDAVEKYRLCLRSIPIFMNNDWLSRKLQEYLKPRGVTTLHFPNIDYLTNAYPETWWEVFLEMNTDWKNRVLPEIHTNLIEGFTAAWNGYQQTVDNDAALSRYHLTRFRFFTGKLAAFGFQETLPTLIDALKEPGLLKNPRWLIESIVYQNGTFEFLDLMIELSQRDYAGDSYLRAIIAHTISHLPEDFQANYSRPLSEYLIDCVQNGSLAEKLMATEALVLAIRFPEIDYCMFERLLESEDAQKYPQLYRNLVMLVQIFCSQQTDLRLVWHLNDPSVHFAYQVSEEMISALRKKREHNEVRKYYRSEYPVLDNQEDGY